MEPKTCSSCRHHHFNDYDLCSWCAAERQRELERRLRESDKAASFMSIAAMALYGKQPRFKQAWRIGQQCR